MSTTINQVTFLAITIRGDKGIPGRGYCLAVLQIAGPGEPLDAGRRGEAATVLLAPATGEQEGTVCQAPEVVRVGVSEQKKNVNHLNSHISIFYMITI